MHHLIAYSYAIMVQVIAGSFHSIYSVKNLRPKLEETYIKYNLVERITTTENPKETTKTNKLSKDTNISKGKGKGIHSRGDNRNVSFSYAQVKEIDSKKKDYFLVPRWRRYPQYEAGESDHKDKVVRLSEPPLRSYMATKSMVIPYYGCPNKTTSHLNCSEDVLVDGQTVVKDLLVNENKGKLLKYAKEHLRGNEEMLLEKLFPLRSVIRRFSFNKIKR